MSEPPKGHPGYDESISPADERIARIVRGLDPIDWVQMRLMASLSLADRVQVVMDRAEVEKAVLRARISQLDPHLKPWQVNMKVLAHFTPIRMPKSDPRHPDTY